MRRTRERIGDGDENELTAVDAAVGVFIWRWNFLEHAVSALERSRITAINRVRAIIVVVCLVV